MGNYQSFSMLELLLRTTTQREEAASCFTVAMVVCSADAAVSHPLHYAGSINAAPWDGGLGRSEGCGHIFRAHLFLRIMRTTRD